MPLSSFGAEAQPACAPLDASAPYRLSKKNAVDTEETFGLFGATAMADAPNLAGIRPPQQAQHAQRRDRAAQSIMSVLFRLTQQALPHLVHRHAPDRKFGWFRATDNVHQVQAEANSQNMRRSACRPVDFSRVGHELDFCTSAPLPCSVKSMPSLLVLGAYSVTDRVQPKPRTKG